MRKSNIFDSFVKIALEKGLISNAAEHTEKDFSQPNPRMDSLSIEQISKLYHNKPDLPKDMQYAKNIMEIAHPQPQFVSPSYDKLNGLVENENEGQNIRLHIVMKDPNGHLNQAKYAQQQLLLSLVKTGNQLDNYNKEQLCKLTDICLKQAALTKKSWILPAIGALAAVVGIIYLKQHMSFHSDGWNTDYQKTQQEIEDLLNSNSNLGVGYQYTPEFLQTVQELQQILSQINDAVQHVMPLLSEIEKPRTDAGLTQQLAALAKSPTFQQADAAVKELTAVVKNNLVFLNKVLSDFNNEGYKQRSIAEKGAITQVVDTLEIFHGGAGLIADDFDDVAHALQTLKKDLVNIVNGLKGAQNAKMQFAAEAQAAQSEVDSTFTPSETSEQTSEETPSAISNLENKLKNFSLK